MASIYEDYVKWMKGGGAVFQSQAAKDAQAGIVASAAGGSGGGNSAPRGQSPLEWGIDIISRPLYANAGIARQRISNISSAAVQAAKDVRSGKVSKEDANKHLLMSILKDVNKDTPKAAFEGLTSTDPSKKTVGVDLIDLAGQGVVDIQRAAGRNVPDYEAPTIENMKQGDLGHFGAAIARGAGGLAADVALDPLTFTTFGIAPALKAGAKALTSAVRGGSRSAKAAAEAAPATSKAVSTQAPVSRAIEDAPVTARETEWSSVGKAQESLAASPSTQKFGAANVASDTPSPAIAAALRGESPASVSLPKVSSGKVPELPKVSDTLSTHHEGIVAALLKTNKELDKAGATAREIAREAAPTPKKPSAKGTEGTLDMVEPVRVSLEGVKKPLLQNVRLPGANRAVDLYPTTIINELGKRNLQGQREFINYIIRQAKERGAITPELRRIVAAAKSALEGASATPQAARTAGKSPSAPAQGVTQAAENLGETGRAELLRSILKTPAGKPTPLGKELRAALGDKLFRQITSTRTKPEVREQIFDELSTLAKDADSLSPATFDGMHESVRHFVEDTLHLLREDFDLATRQKVLEAELYAARPKIIDKATARGIDPQTLKGAEAATGRSARELANRYDAQATRIAGDHFNPNKGKWEGGNYVFKTEDGRRYVIEDGNIGTHAFATWADGARKTIDATVPVSTSGHYAGKVDPRNMTAARRANFPAALREVEKGLDESGILMGVKVDGVKVPMKPSHIYDSAEDAIRATRQERGKDAARALERRLDRMLFNPGTSIPDSLLYEAMGAALSGKPAAELTKILGRTESVYNKEPIKRQPMGVGRAGGRSPSGHHSADSLRAEALDTILALAPGVKARGVGMAREYAEKSISDAGAVATRVETEFAEQMARGEGPAMEYLAGIERRITELSREYGASGHAVGLASESLSKQLPPWIVLQAKQIRSTQTAYRNAARAGKSVDEMRVMGAASEIRHTPVEVNAAADDFEWLARQADELAEEGDELYGLGTDAASVLNEEMQSRSLWRQMTHKFQTGFNARYGATVDGVDMTEAGRWAMGSAAKSIYYRNRDISEWGKRHNTIRIGDSHETVGSAAFKLLQQGMDEVPPEMLQLPHGAHLAQALQELKPIAQYYFDVPGSQMAGDMYWRSGAQNIRYLERSMERAGLSKKYGDVFEEGLIKGEVENWWRNIDVENPVEFLQQYNIAVHHALGERLSMLRLTKVLKDAGLMSTKAKPGFAKPQLEGNSFFYAGLHESGAFVDKRVLDAMSEVDKKLYAARGFGENHLITTVVDPALSAWKIGMTIYRLGHHVRNTLSNGMLAFVDQGVRNLGKSGYVAARILSRREGDRGLAGMSELERLLTGAQTGLRGDAGNTVAYSTKLRNGKLLKITYDDLNDAFSTRGGPRTYMQSENIQRGRGALQRGSDLATFRGTKAEKVAAGLSEGLDHHGYLQHFIQIVMNNASKVGSSQFKTLDDLYDYAIRRAYKFHPDSQVLSPFEAKYVSRIIPFYTWFRGTLPGVMESAFMHPGRVAVAHKASFNIAQTFGIDAESYSNPFPEDADVPDYLREGVFGANVMFGDQMYVLNPGFAHQDLAKMFFGRGPEEGGNFASAMLSNAGRELIAMLNPMIRLPIELSSGVNLQRGSKIQDKADHIDQSLPYINYLTQGTGIQFTGNLLDPLGAIAQGRPHEISSVQRGYRPSIFEEGIGEDQHRRVLNWLFGQGAQAVDTSEQAALKEAQRDARLAAREDGEDVANATGAATASSRSRSSKNSVDVEELLAALTIPEMATAPAPAELDMAAVDAMEKVLQGYNSKPLTSSQRLSAAKALREDDLRRQSAMHYSDYAYGNLQALQQANPNLSIDELLAILKYGSPNPYK